MSSLRKYPARRAAVFTASAFIPLRSIPVEAVKTFIQICSPHIYGSESKYNL